MGWPGFRCAPAAKNKSEKNRRHCFCQFSGLVIGTRLAPFFAYNSLVSFADSQIKTKHQYFGAKICYLPFCLYFLSFFSCQKKFRQKLACAQLSAKKKQLNTKKFCAFNF